MSMQNTKKNSYLSRNIKWLIPFVILALCLLIQKIAVIIGERNVIPEYILKFIVAIALFTCAFYARMTSTISANIFINTIYCLGFCFLVFILYKLFSGEIQL